MGRLPSGMREGQSPRIPPECLLHKGNPWMLKGKRNEQNFSHLGIFFSSSMRCWTNLCPPLAQEPSSGRPAGTLLVAGKGTEFSWLQSCVPLFTGSSWKLAGHSNAAAVDEEQMLSQTKVNMACRGWVRKKKIKGLMQLLPDFLCRGTRKKAGFSEDDGWTDGNCTLIQTTEARGYWVLSS